MAWMGEKNLAEYKNSVKKKKSPIARTGLNKSITYL